MKNPLPSDRARIAICLEYPIGVQGGVSVLCDILVRELASRYRIVLVSDDTANQIESAGLTPLIEKHIRWNPLENSRSRAREFAEELAATRVSVAHFHSGGNFGWGAPRLQRTVVPMVARKGIRVISTVHLVANLLDGYCDIRKPLWFKLVLFPLAWLGKMYVLSYTAREVAVSQHDLKKLQSWYRPLRNRFVQIYHTRLRSVGLENAGLRQPVILNVGHIAWRKGQVVLAKAFAHLAVKYPEWTLQLAGHDGGEGSVEQIRELGKKQRLEDRIALMGQRTDALDLMRSASIYVQPSYWEGLGLALQEAMFCRCAVIGTRAGGIPELIDHERTGLLVPPGNVTELAAAIERLVLDEDLRRRFGEAACVSMHEKKMTVAGMVERHIELYDATLRRH